MNLTESKLKQMILEAMGTTPLPHLDKITDLFAKSFEDGKQSASFVGSLDEYVLRKDPIIRESEYNSLIGLRFKHLSQANEFYEALLPKLQEPISARISIYGKSGTVNIIYPNPAKTNFFTESKDRDNHIDAAFNAIEFYEEGFGGEEPTRNSEQALRGLANLISKGIIACIKQGPSYATTQMELINKAKELGIFDEVAGSVIDMSKDDVSPEIRLK